ncbi:tetratricopeptide repeat protein [Luteitalea sp.]|jgi:Flp pilus assembly protein TadD|uniref:tetratricopeptide repeat protein n=1 Tax=Luteitalea sp. TaxID=2004800 RepID=UPI0025C10EE2|nr:tetratricopeptide repeat protein [Luteitalea sp.]
MTKPRSWMLALALVLGASGVASAQDARKQAQSQVEFGIAVAQRGLWQEAVFRWERASEIDPTYAAAFNNLGIAYEQLGKFEQAGKAYEKALELEPQNLSIQQNYDLFKEINDRAKRNSGS